jgi:hypothetical protein
MGCKVVYNHAKDWLDIDSMLCCEADFDTPEVLRWVGRLAGNRDPRYTRIAFVLTR